MGSEHKKATAKKLLVHYFSLVMKQAGGTLDSDNVAEIEQIIDEIFSDIDDVACHMLETVDSVLADAMGKPIAQPQAQPQQKPKMYKIPNIQGRSERQEYVLGLIWENLGIQFTGATLTELKQFINDHMEASKAASKARRQVK